MRPLTERQLNAINAISRSLGWTKEELRERSIEAYGAPPEELSRADASALITEMQSRSAA